jgi:cytochrome P450
VAPNAVSISDGSALHTIYVAGGGFRKDSRYENFDLDGHATIFSALDTAYRDLRAKSVLPLFAMGRVRAASEGQGVIRECVDEFVKIFESEKAKALINSRAAKVDILDLAVRLSIDVVTSYLFNRRYGALEEPKESLASQVSLSKINPKSEAPFLMAVVEFGRFSLLPNWLFVTLGAVFGLISSNDGLKESIGRVDDFTVRLVNDADPERDDTYQSRLLAAGISKSETTAQCKAVLFAGGDSTAVKLSTILFHLVQNPSIHERLKEEIKVLGSDPATDPQTLPYLRAVVREGLRLGMGNPARLTRVVPSEGLEVGGIRVPAGTTVGLAAYTLHHNPELYPEPFAFRPERWLDVGKEPNGKVDVLSEGRKRDMERDLIPFGAGLRTCLAKNLATHELFLTVRSVVESGVLEGARTCKKTIELEEWFNVGIKGHVLDIEWSR